ncbi:MAG: patatin-like phospholipase family protein [Candidatus Bipolaricaulia bacterium]
MSKPIVGVALGSGGARGLAHIGVLRALRKHDIPIDCVAGTSIGAAIGGAFVSGIDMEQLADGIKKIDLKKLLDIPEGLRGVIRRILGRTASEYLFHRDWHTPPSESQVQTRAMCQLFAQYAEDTEFENLDLPFIAVAVDIDTGEPVFIQEGLVCHAVEASSTVPIAFYPVEYQGRYLVDGAIVDPVPIDAVIRMGANRVIAVDVGAVPLHEARSTLDVLAHADLASRQQLTRLHEELARERLGEENLVVLRPDLHETDWTAFDCIDDCVTAGEREAEKHLDRIRAMVGQTQTSDLK